MGITTLTDYLNKNDSMIKKWKQIGMTEQCGNTDLFPHQIQLFSILNQNQFHSVSAITQTINQILIKIKISTPSSSTTGKINKLKKKEETKIEEHMYIQCKNGEGQLRLLFITATPCHSSSYIQGKTMMQRCLMKFPFYA